MVCRQIRELGVPQVVWHDVFDLEQSVTQCKPGWNRRQFLSHTNEDRQNQSVGRNIKIGNFRLTLPIRTSGMQRKRRELGGRAPPNTRSIGTSLLENFHDWEYDYVPEFT